MNGFIQKTKTTKRVVALVRAAIALRALLGHSRNGAVRARVGVDGFYRENGGDDEGCLWPLGEPGTPGFRYCGSPRSGDKEPYCPLHHAVAHVGMALVPIVIGEETALSRENGPWTRNADSLLATDG